MKQARQAVTADAVAGICVGAVAGWFGVLTAASAGGMVEWGSFVG